MATANLLDKLERAYRELDHSLRVRLDTPAYDMKDVEMRDLLQDAIRRIRMLEAEVSALHARERRRHNQGLGGAPAVWR